MKNYVRPVIVAADQLAEGVYMSLSGETEPVALDEALSAATGEGGKPENAQADDMTGGAEQSVGGTETQTDTASDNGADSESEADTTDTANAADTADAGKADTTDDAGQADAADAPEAQAETETESDADTDSADDAIDESGDMQGSAMVTCDSQYMSGVWQGAKEGSWGGVKLGCKEVLGCQGCPADKGDGCGLQDANAASRYLHSMGTLMPEWEASGKLPADSPYGI